VSTEAVQLRFPAQAEYLLLARLAVSGVARRMGLGGKEVADLKLAVTEACSNAVRHAYPAAVSGVIELELVTRDDRLELVVEDHGAGFVPHVWVPPPPSERGGMGLPIIRAVMDELVIRPGADGGTVVHMTKLAAQSRPDEDGRVEV